MKHLDPKQIEAPVDAKPKKKASLLLWASTVLALCFGLGAAGTAMFVPEPQDRVTDKEKQERQIAFTRVRDLHVLEVEATKVDASLDEMRLAPPERKQMRALLSPAASGTLSGSSTSTAAFATGNPPLRLVSVSLWDSHAEDGDVVAVISGGYRREVALTKAVQTITFPVDSSSQVQFVGVRDGGGGITLGLRGPSQEILMPIMSEGQTLSLPIAR
jgi:hypothetical protein